MYIYMAVADPLQYPNDHDMVSTIKYPICAHSPAAINGEEANNNEA